MTSASHARPALTAWAGRAAARLRDGAWRTATRPGGLADRDAELATQLHLLARDVAALVDPAGARSART